MIWVKRIIFTLIVGIIVIFIGAAIFLSTLDANQLKDKFAQQISKQINRSVSVRSAKFDFSISQGVKLHISGLTIMDDPDFSSSAFFYVDSAHLNIEVLPLITNRRILISKIEFDSPTVQLIRNSLGKLNVQTFTKIKQAEQVKQSAVSQEGSSTDKADEDDNPAFLGEILVRSIQMSDGSVHFIDGMVSPATKIGLTQMELQISNLTAQQAFPVRFEASLFSDKKNIQLNGLARFDLGFKQGRVDDMSIKTDLSDMSVDRIIESFPSVKSSGLYGKLGGRLTLDVQQMVFTEKGLEAIASELRLTDGYVQIKDAPLALENLNMHFVISESDLEIMKINLPIASGEINASGRIFEYLSEQKFTGKLDISNIQLSELTADMDLPVKIEGRLQGSFKGSGNGLSKKALESSLVGEGSMNIDNGRIVDVNILKLVLSKLSFIPNLVGQVEENLPERYKEKLKKNDTTLEKAEFDMRLRNNTVTINQAKLNADGFLVIANGKMDFDQNLTLDANLYIPEDLSASMIASAQDLKLLLDDRNQIHIPFKQYRGKLSRFRMVPDVEDLGLAVIKNRGRDELRKVIFKALDIEEQPAAQPTEGESGEPQEREIRPEEAIIESILDIIPIF